MLHYETYTSDYVTAFVFIGLFAVDHLLHAPG